MNRDLGFLRAGFSKLTNEAQRQGMVLPRERIINNSASLSAAKLPDYRPRDYQNAKSRQLWIARHLPSLGS